MNTNSENPITNLIREHWKQFVLAGLAIGAIYVVSEHPQHVRQLLPFAILLLCPFLHLFMHGDHGDHDQHTGHNREVKTEGDKDHKEHDHQHDSQPPQGGQS